MSTAPRYNLRRLAEAPAGIQAGWRNRDRGNASGINDGAASGGCRHRRVAKAHELSIRAEIVSHSIVGLKPDVTGAVLRQPCLPLWVKNPHLDHGYAVDEPFQPGPDRRPCADPTRIPSWKPKTCLNNRMAYVAVSRGAYDAQILQTNNREELGAALGHECLAQQRPCAGDEAGTEAGAGSHAAAGDCAEAGAELGYWFGPLGLPSVFSNRMDEPDAAGIELKQAPGRIPASIFGTAGAPPNTRPTIYRTHSKKAGRWPRNRAPFPAPLGQNRTPGNAPGPNVPPTTKRLQPSAADRAAKGKHDGLKTLPAPGATIS